MSLKERAKKLKKEIPVIYLSFMDKETPVLAKVIAGITIAYALSPIDFIPDFIPVLGYLDDILLLPALAALSICLIPEEVLERNRASCETMWKDGKPRKWYFAIPIVLFWLLILRLVVKAFLRLRA